MNWVFEERKLTMCLIIIIFFFLSKSNDMAAVKEEHLAAVRVLEEAHTKSLSKMAETVTELER